MCIGFSLVMTRQLAQARYVKAKSIVGARLEKNIAMLKDLTE